MLILWGSFQLTTFASELDPAEPVEQTPQQDGVILVFGDSISAAYGMAQEQGWVHLLSEQFEQNNIPYRIVNASVSGETTGGGLIRLPKTLDIHQPDIVIIELGGNDGLRGYPISKIQNNLLELTSISKATGARVLLVGMVLPPNYGRRYTNAFEKVFTDIADSQLVPILPFLLDGVSTSRNLLQKDGIHPTVEAQPLLRDEIWPLLKPMLSLSPEH
jgi:acyl-CoA thioesterase-1